MAGEFRWSKEKKADIDVGSLQQLVLEEASESRGGLLSRRHHARHAAVIGFYQSINKLALDYYTRGITNQDAVASVQDGKVLIGANKDEDHGHLFGVEAFGDMRLSTIAVELGRGPVSLIPGLWLPAEKQFHPALAGFVEVSMPVEQVREEYGSTPVVPAP